MITQDFLLELEMAMLRAYAQASRKVKSRSQREPNFLGGVKYNEEMVREFMSSFASRSAALEAAIARGGHQDYARIAGRVQRLVEDKVRVVLTKKTLSHQDFDEKTLHRSIEELKNDVRSIFYEKGR